MEKENVSKEKEVVSLETMTGVGKKKTIAGREYTILPVNIKDMHYILEGADKIILIDKKTLEEDNASWQVFGLNITDEKKKKVFLEMVNKYVYYLDRPMTEEMLIEHGWSFKEIGEFLLSWAQISD